MVSKIQKLIGSNLIVEVDITQGMGGFPYKKVCLMDTKGITCLRAGGHSILFLARNGECADENFMVPLVIPKDTKLSKKKTKNEITGADTIITGVSSSLIFEISYVKQPA